VATRAGWEIFLADFSWPGKVGTGGLEEKENDFMYFSCLGTLANPGKRKIGGSGG